MKTSDAVRMFLLGVIAALLAAIALRPGGQEAQAQMTGAASGNIIALTSSGPGNDQITLFLIDPAKQTIAYYTARSSSPFSLRDVRWYKDDLNIYYRGGERSGLYNSNGISVREVEELVKKHGGK